MFRPKRKLGLRTPPTPRVSILVLVDVSPEDGVTRPVQLAHEVSILVLVDVSPEDQKKIARGKHRRFQSLFSWMFRPKQGSHDVR